MFIKIDINIGNVYNSKHKINKKRNNNEESSL